MADLRDPAAAAARQRATERAALDAQLATSRTRIADVLDSAPWPDPADRNRGHLRDAARDQVKATMEARAAAAAIAVERAAQLRGRVGIMGRALALAGVQTPSMKAAVEAAREADQAERAAKDSRIDFREHLAQADRSGSAQAEQRQRDQDRWEDRPDVRAARHEEAGNKLVAAALWAGDPEIKEALRREDGLTIAREVLARREAERLAEIQRQQQLHEQRTAAAATALRPGPAMPAPEPRR